MTRVRVAPPSVPELRRKLHAARHDIAVRRAGVRVRGDHDLNPGLYPEGPLRPAAVLVPIIERSGGMSVLLTRRTGHLQAHAGQISFPGGRLEEGDSDAVAAALRETEEEIGLARDRVDVVGRLDTYQTRTGFEITPFVGLVRLPFRLTLDSFEVEEAFELPLEFVLDPTHHQRHSRVEGGVERYFYVLPYRDYFIWGATAGMLVNLYEILAGEL